ncbi:MULTISPECIES: alpha/beta fold hydrolase [Microbacterium]|uniref:alpha/beta fold hydrolase n=1 Tax=Microbacterium TaxID=33882 RepID=UPI00217EA138|nr:MULTISPECIES: alpha/beta hydrolase [Microbacterium]
MSTDLSEFRYLPGQARALGVAAPAVERLALTLPDGRTLSALRYGAGTPEATFLHGAGLNAHTWDTTLLLLGRPALAIDLAGHGDSSWREDRDYSPRTLAADVALALEEWTDRPQVLVGQSLGGLTGAAVAARHPQLVRSLVVVDITPGLDTEAAPAVLRDFYTGATDFASREEAVDRAQAFGFGGSRADTERGVFLNTRERPDGRIEWKHHFAHIVGHALSTFERTVADRTEPDRTVPEDAEHGSEGWADLAAVTAPITLVRGADGFLQDADVDEFTRRVPAASVITVEARHNVQETAPAALASLVSDALGRPAR